MKMAKGLSTANAVNVGFLATAKYPDGTSVAQNAIWQEFGTTRATSGDADTKRIEHVPPRPFFRTMIADKSPKWPESLAYVLKANHYDAARALASMGEGIKGQLVESIVNWSEPPNAPATIAAKGFNKPLIDQGVMQRAVAYEVVNR